MSKNINLISKICLNSDVIYSGNILNESPKHHYYRVTNTEGNLINTYAESTQLAIENAKKLGLRNITEIKIIKKQNPKSTP